MYTLFARIIGYRKKTPQQHPAKQHGVYGLCPLSSLKHFDIIWDIMPDMMHICKGVLAGHLIPLMKGDRAPAKPKKPTPPTGLESDPRAAEEKYNAKRAAYLALKSQQAALADEQKSMKLTTAQRAEVDIRAKALAEGNKHGRLMRTTAPMQRSGT